MASVQRSRFTHLLTTATIAALLPLAPVTAAAEDVEKPVTIATSGKLNWGIRESFNNYTNGASKVEDGATLISTNNFEFKLEKATYDAAKERTEAQFRGKNRLLEVLRRYENFHQLPTRSDHQRSQDRDQQRGKLR